MKIFKRILGIALSVIGVVMFLSLYLIIILNRQDYVKHIVTILGYLSVAIFACGIVLIKTTITKKENEKTKEIN